MNHVTITGPQAHIEWGYYQAVRVGSWSIDVGPGGGTLSGQVLSADAFRVSQQPLTFVVPRPNGQPWRWPITSLQIAADAFSATLGPQE